jgi:hypothetical protein
LRSEQRIVTKIPLSELWDENGTITQERLRNLDRANLADILLSRSIQFVVADCGLKLKWIPTQEQVELWKKVEPQIADPLKPIHLDRFPNEIAYVASEWHGHSGQSLILLEKHH